jgi:cobalt-precorrin 5A hydrolase
VRRAVGLGCRPGVAAEAVAAAVAAVLADLPAVATPMLATLAGRRGEAGLAEAAARLGLPLVFLPPAALAEMAPGAVTRSERVVALFGVPSVAETAALAAIGPGARLVRPRRVVGSVTVAVAEDGEAVAEDGDAGASAQERGGELP